jgi:autotransporter-associated beta strand protein
MILAGHGVALGQYTGTTTWTGANSPAAPFPWTDPLNWTAGVPNATTVAIIPDGTTQTPISLAAGDNPVYGISFARLTPETRIDTGRLVLLSTDSVIDAATNRHVALAHTTVGGARLEITSPIQLGDGTVPSGVYTVLNTGNSERIRLSGTIVEAPGTVAGLTLAGTQRSELRGANSTGNYGVNRYNFSGQFTIAAGAGARVYNNLLPYGVGRPNLQLDGEFRNSANGGVMVLNAIDSADATATYTRQAGNEVFVGANGNDGTYRGTINATTLRFWKVGAGTQTFTSQTNAMSRLTMLEGTISVDSMANTGTVSSAGNAETAATSLTFDGGTLRYTGAGHTSNRLMTVGFRGGSLDASGTGALVLNGASGVTSSDNAFAVGDVLATGTSQVVPNMYGLNGLGARVAAGQLNIALVTLGAGITAAAGTVPVAIDESARTMTLPEGSTVGVGGNGIAAPLVTFASTVGLDRTFTLTGSSTAANQLGMGLANSTLGGQLSLNKTGAGRWIVSGANTYTGATTVNAGTLEVNGTHTGGAAYTVAANATLGGTGTIGSAISSTGGRIAPGSGGVGTLTATSTLAMDANSALAIEIESASSFDKAVVSGAATVGGKIELATLGGYVPAAGESFTVLTGSSVSGTFSNAFGHARAADGKGGLLIEVTPTSVVLKDYQRIGDVDISGAVNNQDIAPFVALLTGGNATGAVGFSADVDGNGVVNNQDIAPFVALLTGGRPLADVAGDPEFAPLIALVPEPGTLSLLAVAGVLALRRRRGC